MTKRRNSPPGVLDFSELPEEVKAKINPPKAKRTRVQTMTKEQVRGHAIRVLNEITDLTDSERERVLNMALKLNGV